MSNRTFWTFVVISVIMGIALIWGSGAQMGALLEKQTNPVCHAITEDSDMSDCSYHNGAWYHN